MKKWPFLLLSGILSLLAAGCRTGGGTPVYDVVVVGGGPAGIGAALAAAETGARTALLERDSRVGGTTVQAEVCDMGLFYAWRRPIITGPGWEMVRRAVAEAGGTLPDFSRQEPDKWMESCVRVDPVVYARVAEETLRQAGVITEKDYLEGLVPEDALSWSYWMVDEHNAGTSGAAIPGTFPST